MTNEGQQPVDARVGNRIENVRLTAPRSLVQRFFEASPIFQEQARVVAAQEAYLSAYQRTLLEELADYITRSSKSASGEFNAMSGNNIRSIIEGRERITSAPDEQLYPFVDTVFENARNTGVELVNASGGEPWTDDYRDYYLIGTADSEGKFSRIHAILEGQPQQDRYASIAWTPESANPRYNLTALFISTDGVDVSNPTAIGEKYVQEVFSDVDWSLTESLQQTARENS